MPLLIFLVILLVLIIAHEAGHFIAAKMSRMRVDEFGVGFPPRFFSFKRGETTYSFNWLPFGGFVKIYGEDASTSGEVIDKKSFVARPRSLQAFVIAAGIICNVILAWVLLSAGYMAGLPAAVGGVPYGARVENARIIVTDVLPGSPAEEAGILPGDSVLALVTNTDALQEISPESITGFITEHAEEGVGFLYDREGSKGTIFVTPKEGIADNRAVIGIVMGTTGNVYLSPRRAFIEGGKLTVLLTKETAKGLYGFFGTLFRGQADLSSVAGPVGLVGLTGEAADRGIAFLLAFTALISINLALINLVPFPALDGGRLLFIIIETIKRSPIKPRIAQATNAVVFALLVALMAVVTYSDIARLF